MDSTVKQLGGHLGDGHQELKAFADALPNTAMQLDILLRFMDSQQGCVPAMGSSAGSAAGKWSRFCCRGCNSIQSKAQSGTVSSIVLAGVPQAQAVIIDKGRWQPVQPTSIGLMTAQTSDSPRHKAGQEDGTARPQSQV